MKQSTAARDGRALTVEESDVGQLVRASADGSEAAWNELVRRYSPVVAAVTRRYRLAAEDAQDVCQTVWLRLVEHLADLLEPEALPGWLAVTARRECGRQARQRRRDLRADPHADPCAAQRLPEPVDLDDRLLRAELRQAVHNGLVQLPAREQRLLRLWSDDPPATYQEISQHLGVPIGSIGPTLRRSLDKLRRTSAMRSYLAAPAGSDRREFAEAS